MRPEALKHASFAPELLGERGACPLCDCQQTSVHMEFRPIPVVRCEQCGFLFTSRVLTDDAMAEYYQDFGSTRQRQGQQINAMVNFRAVCALLDPQPGQSMLDIGTGYGFLLTELRDRRSMRVAGVELSKDEAEFAIERLGLDVRCSLLRDAGFERESFDVVASFETIEHVSDPVGFLRELASYAKPGGRVLTMTDNFQSWAVRKLGPEFPKWIPHMHVSDFSDRTLPLAIERAEGLSYENGISYTNWEMLAKAFRSVFRSTRRPEECFDLEECLRSDRRGSQPLFRLRRVINSRWFSLSRRRDLRGCLMYALARKDT